ncbi:hypothetical protein HDZ31DRAFT_78593, partial [Schizophyllum fasciatum]
METFAALPSAPDPSRPECQSWTREMIHVLDNRFESQLMSPENDIRQRFVEVERYQTPAPTMHEVAGAMETTVMMLKETFHSAIVPGLFARLDIACDIAFQLRGLDLFNTHVFQLHPDFELPLPTWRALLAKTLACAWRFEGAGTFERIVTTVRSRPAAMNALLRVYRTRNTMDSFGVHRPYEGISTLAAVCHRHPDIRDEVTRLFDTEQVLASLVDISNCAGIAIPPWLFAAARTALHAKLSRLPDVHRYGTNRRTYSSVPPEILQSWLDPRLRMRRDLFNDFAHLVSVDDPNPLALFSHVYLYIRIACSIADVRASVQVPVVSTLANFSFLTCLHRMPYDTHVTGLNVNNIPVLQTMTAYIHAALKAHFQGLTTNPLNPLLTADNIAY